MKINSNSAILDITTGRSKLLRHLENDGTPIPITIEGVITRAFGSDDGFSQYFKLEVKSLSVTNGCTTARKSYSRPSRTLSPEVKAQRSNAREFSRINRLMIAVLTTGGRSSASELESYGIPFRDIDLGLRRNYIVRSAPGVYERVPRPYP